MNEHQQKEVKLYSKRTATEHSWTVSVDRLKEDCDLSAKNPAEQADIDHMPPSDIPKLIQTEDEQVQTLLCEIGDLLEVKS